MVAGVSLCLYLIRVLKGASGQAIETQMLKLCAVSSSSE